MMIYRLAYHPLAVEELNDAVIWYETKQEGRGVKFLQYLEGQLAQLCGRAESYPFTRGYFREFPIRLYPFIIVYRLKKREKILFINSIFHMSRNPAQKYRK